MALNLLWPFMLSKVYKSLLPLFIHRVGHSVTQQTSLWICRVPDTVEVLRVQWRTDGAWCLLRGEPDFMGTKPLPLEDPLLEENIKITYTKLS